MSTDISTYYEFILAQFAAESYLDRIVNFTSTNQNDVDLLTERLVNGANHYNFIQKLNDENELSPTQMTDVMVGDFFDTWEIVNHQANTSSGFSATVLKNKNTEEFTLSFRSTESGCGVRSCLLLYV